MTVRNDNLLLVRGLVTTQTLARVDVQNSPVSASGGASTGGSMTMKR